MQVTDEMVRVACDVYDSAPEADGADVAMRAALTAALDAMWRPIEGAPKDGRRILAIYGGQTMPLSTPPQEPRP